MYRYFGTNKDDLLDDRGVSYRSFTSKLKGSSFPEEVFKAPRQIPNFNLLCAKLLLLRNKIREITNRFL